MDFGIGSIRRSLRKLSGSRNKKWANGQTGCNGSNETDSQRHEAVVANNKSDLFVQNNCSTLNSMQTKVIAEIFSTERSYLENLDILLKVFFVILYGCYIAIYSIYKIFSIFLLF